MCQWVVIRVMHVPMGGYPRDACADGWTRVMYVPMGGYQRDACADGWLPA